MRVCVCVCVCKATGGIGLPVNVDETRYISLNQNQIRDISTLLGSSLKLVEKSHT